MFSIQKHIKNIRVLQRHLNLGDKTLLGMLVPYYALTIACAVLEGTSMLLLVSWFTGTTALNSFESLPPIAEWIVSQLHDGSRLISLVWLLVVMFGVTVAIRSLLVLFDAVTTSLLRRKLQERVFRCYIVGDWGKIGTFRVGEAVGTTATEAATVAKYLSSAVAVGYFLLNASAMAWLALSTSLKLSLSFIVIAFPLVILMKTAIAKQAQYSKKIAFLRNTFSSDITDRYNGLLQVHVDDRDDFHISKGTRIQSIMTTDEVKMSAYQAIIGSFNLLLPFMALLGVALWLLITGREQFPAPAMIAGVGVLGIKIAGQLNGLIASIGNMSRLSGSIHPVLEAFNIPEKRPRQDILERVVEIEVNDVIFGYGERIALDGIRLKAIKGRPLILSGRSGVGKTTFANIIGGLYFPAHGHVNYIGASGKRYDSKAYKAHVGFVTQDIYIFQGTLRDSLTSGRRCSDDQIWNILKTVDAADFVQALGGLDIESAEAGRDFSGGQRRRLGIARVLLMGADILIFDEITSGLDQLNRAAVLAIIERLSLDYLVVIITHEELLISNQQIFTL